MLTPSPCSRAGDILCARVSADVGVGDLHLSAHTFFWRVTLQAFIIFAW